MESTDLHNSLACHDVCFLFHFSRIAGSALIQASQLGNLSSVPRRCCATVTTMNMKTCQQDVLVMKAEDVSAGCFGNESRRRVSRTFW